MIEQRASYEQDVVVQPIGRQCLIRVLEEPKEVGGILLPPSVSGSQTMGRSFQGVIVAVGMHTSDPDILESARSQRPVLFDDQGCSWWKGGLLPNYLGAVLDEGEEYVLVPDRQILCGLEY